MPLNYSATAHSFSELLMTLQEFISNNATQPATTENTEGLVTTPVKRGRKPKVELTQTISGSGYTKQESEPEAEKEPEKETEEASALSYADVSKITIKIATTDGLGRSVASKLLKEFGAVTPDEVDPTKMKADAKKVKPEQYADYVAAAQKILDENESVNV